MSNDENQPVWDFKVGEKKKEKKTEEEKPSFEFEIPDWLKNNVRPIVGMSAILLVAVVILPLLGKEAEEPTVDIPGGEIKQLTGENVENWIGVMEAAADRARSETAEQGGEQNSDSSGKSTRLSVHSSTLLSFCSELQHRNELRDIFEKLCNERKMKFAQFKEITREIGVASPYGNMQGLEDPKNSNSDASRRVKNFRENRKLVEEYGNQIRSAWDRFQEYSHKTSKITRTSGGNNES